MKVLGTTTTNKVVAGGGMEESVIELQVKNLQGNGSVSALLCKPEQPIDTCSKKSMFPFRLKRSSTHTGIHSRPTNKPSQLFGQPLPADATIPKPIAEVLMLLWRKGPGTEGVFRKPCNKKNLNTVRDQLDSGAEVDLNALPVTLLVGLLKTFLREIPGSLMVAKHYDEWIEALQKEDVGERLTELKRLVSNLPEANGVLLQYLLCVLHHIILQSEKNKMEPKNLAICLAPTLLQPSSQPLDVITVEKVNSLTQFLIERCSDVFGEKIITLLGDPEQDELEDNSETSLHHHDSAYDSPDPDGDGESGEAMGHSQDGGPHPRNRSPSDHSHSSEDIFETFNKPVDRRCSEPAIFPTNDVASLRFLARSHDDCSSARAYEDQPLKKQTSEDSFLQQQRRPFQPSLRKTIGSLSLDVAACSCSSSCSLESANSNISESSVFATSPLPSPSSPRKSQLEKHHSLSVKFKSETDSRRSFPFKRTQSLGSFSSNRGSSKKSEAQKDVAFSCETLQEDSQNEVEVQDEPVRRQRPLSAVEVFDHVDRRDPGRPPSYEQAMLSGVLPAPPEYRAMTVHHARELGRRARPISMNDNILDVSPVNQYLDRLTSSNDALNQPQQNSFRQRAMSESVGCTRIQKLSRRCSQPVFEELSYAKESYV